MNFQDGVSAFGIRERNFNNPVKPSRRRRLHHISIRFVAPIIFTSPRGSKPSMAARSCTSTLHFLVPEVMASVRDAPMASISDETIDGASLSQGQRVPDKAGSSPIYFWTSSEPTVCRKIAWVSCATAFARRVLPVPGGP